MKKAILLLALAINTHAFAQTSDYRTAEDGINQLINNVDFLEKMSHMSNEQIANTTLNSLLDEYVPEYRGFKAELDNLNLNKVYYTPNSEYATQQLAGGLGKMLGMKDNEVTALQSVFNGSFQNTDLRTASSQFGNSLYKRGKNEAVDYVVDNTNSLLQQQYGSNEGNSALINVGTGLLGSLLFSLTDDNDIDAEKERQYRALVAEQDRRRNEEQTVQGDAFAKGSSHSTQGWIKTNEQKYVEAMVDYGKAIQILNTSYMGGPALIEAYYKRGQTKMYMNDHRGAIIDYYFALNTATLVWQQKWEPTPRVQDNILREVGMKHVGTFSELEIVDILMGRAYAKYQARDFAGAMSDCNKAMNLYKIIDPKDADWKSHPNNFSPTDWTPQLHPLNNLIGLMGMINMAQGNLTEAMEQYNYNISTITMVNSAASVGALPVTFTRELMLAKCYAYYKAGKYDEAIALYNNIIENKTYIKLKGGNVSVAYSGRGNIYLAKKEYNKALSDYNTAIEMKPEETMYYVNRGNCKLLLNDKDGALKDFATAKDPSAMKANAKALDMAKPERQVNSYAWYIDTITKLQVSKKDEASLFNLYEAGMLAFPDSQFVAASFATYIRKTANAKESTLKIMNKLPGEGIAVTGLKALYYNLTGDNKQCMDYSIKVLEKGWSFLNFQYYLYPDFENDPDYCKYATILINKEINGQLPQVRKMWQDFLKDHLATPPSEVLGPNYLLLAQDYYNLGDAANAILYCDKEISGEGKSKYANAITTMVVKQKIKSLIMAGKNKEAVQEAKKYSKPQKRYSFQPDDMFLPFIKATAADVCGYDTK